MNPLGGEALEKRAKDERREIEETCSKCAASAWVAQSREAQRQPEARTSLQGQHNTAGKVSTARITMSQAKAKAHLKRSSQRKGRLGALDVLEELGRPVAVENAD